MSASGSPGDPATPSVGVPRPGDRGVRGVVVAARLHADLETLIRTVSEDPRFLVLGSAGEPDLLLERCRSLRPEVVVLGRMFATENEGILTELSADLPWIRVVVHTDADALPRALGELADQPRSARWILDPDTSNVGAARRITADVLRAWGCDQLIPDAQLVVTELVTNAIVHAETHCEVALQITDDGVRIAVTDRDRSHQPQPRPFDLQREGGRGLLIVSTLAAAWGIAPDGTGKTVWADLVA